MPSLILMSSATMDAREALLEGTEALDADRLPKGDVQTISSGETETTSRRPYWGSCRFRCGHRQRLPSGFSHRVSFRSDGLRFGQYDVWTA